ncbi:Protein CBG23789 [Caenorhabditis briggsae]|uniref:Protein CBG23789 n=1 Tax=Caenorhabditis briggsae TaxID=6238 RepID=H8WGY1_CAEBR|nr:Protein CBG23789 [Caenorhabditis briggsae]CCG58555.1 Protein CBG23789 [Caenorhabditis briggsae]
MFRLGSATRLSPSCVRFIPLFAVIFLLVISFTVFKSSGIEKYQERTNAPYVYINHRVGLSEPDLNEYSVKTHKGYVSLNELNEKYYFNDKNSGWGDKPRNWDRISEIMTYSKKQIANLAYPVESESMYNAMAANRLDNLTGVVVGSMQPWVEVYALKNGAKKILTVEYNKLTIQPEFQDRLSSILPVDFVRNWEKYAGTFDFAASFSSIEHSGLGRYGDPMDPIGDLREMLKIKCMLKPGGRSF